MLAAVINSVSNVSECQMVMNVSAKMFYMAMTPENVWTMEEVADVDFASVMLHSPKVHF